MASRHPYFVENISKERILEMWNESAEKYSADLYGHLKEEIVGYLTSNDFLNIDDTMLDIGSGPGTFAIPLSRHVRRIDCMDSSEAMLLRVVQSCKDEDVENIRVYNCDWEGYNPIVRHDVAFASLCPPTNSPKSILKMDACSKRNCIYISSANKDPDISKDIWRRLGKIYSFQGYDTKYPYEFLRGNGRDPTLRIFEEDTHMEVPLDEMIDREMRRLSAYSPLSQDDKDDVINVIRSYSTEGIVCLDRTVRIGVLTWQPDRH